MENLGPDQLNLILVVALKGVGILAGGVFVYLGYRLFAKGVFGSAGDVEWSNMGLILKKAAPGTVFAAFGAVVVMTSIIAGEVPTARGALKFGIAAQVDTHLIGPGDFVQFEDSLGRPIEVDPEQMGGWNTVQHDSAFFPIAPRDSLWRASGTHFVGFDTSSGMLRFGLRTIPDSVFRRLGDPVN